jgi:replicative DNA helicase
MNIQNRPVLYIPQDTEAEQAVLGAIIFNNEILNDIAPILEPKYFYSEANQHVFRAMLGLVEKDQPIDEILIADQLKSFGKLEEIGGILYLAELLDCCPASGNIVYYANIVKEHALAREVINISNNLSRKSRDPQQNIQELLEDAQKSISDIESRSSKQSYRHIKDVLSDNFQRLEELSENGERISGLKTGFLDLDKLTSGLQPGLIIVAGRPSMGKTSFAMNIGTHVAMTQPEKGAILVFSIETTDTIISSRMLSSVSKIDLKKFKSGNLDQEEWDNLASATDKISGMPLYINDSSKISPGEMVSIAKQLDKEEENGVSGVIVDYLQLAQSKGNPNHREQEIAHITRTLKGLSKELNIPVIALSQLNRALENRKDKRPLMSDTRESGSIEQDADLIIMIYRDEVYDEETDKKGIAEIIIRKHKDGPCGTVELRFEGKFTKFFNLA